MPKPEGTGHDGRPHRLLGTAEGGSGQKTRNFSIALAK